MNWIRSFASIFARGPLLLFFRPVLPGKFAVSFSQLLCMLALSSAVEVAFGLIENPEFFGFNPSGLNTLLANWAVIALLLAVLKTRDRFIDIKELLAAIAVSQIWICAAVLAYHFIQKPILHSAMRPVSPTTAYVLFGIGIAIFFWQFAAVFWAGRQLSQFSAKRFGMRALAAVLLSIVIVPQDRLFYSAAPDLLGQANVWPWIDRWVEKKIARAFKDEFEQAALPPLDFEAILDQQPERLAAELSKIAPSTPGSRNVFFVGMAGFAGQDVFTREIKATRELFDDRFKTSGRSIVLNNNRETVDSLPLASTTNLRKTLRGIAAKMNTEDDILVLFVTSHGAEGYISVEFTPAPLHSLKAKDLAEMLDQSGIKNRVIIISACHSGSFIPSLKNENTAILTAASATKVSFGCSNERDWTYFSDALVNHALRSTHSFTEAFDQASKLVGEWELRDKLTSSDPQIFVGDSIRPKLDELAKDLAQRTANATNH